ncbi:hypothetical protein Gotri_014835 [Gossypium trilobum]|uniref:DUF4283 domain-containing protein n=1 Tax=Gossypium trilobum TaxID=34281 RepID=A0A7J9DY81_9ROSI|nr:hypothetical protein [Gossypium trilobum]
MRSTMVNLWHPVKGVQISDLEGKEIIVSIFPQNGYGSGLWDGEGKKESRTRIDPMLGLNLEGDLKLELDMKGDASKIQGQSDMEHNSEECAIVGGDGKKRPRRDSGNYSKGNVPRSLVGGVPRDERRMDAFRETLKEC